MRSFLAIELPSAQAGQLRQLQSDLGAGRPADPAQFHITLLFLGGADPQRLGALCECLTAERWDPVDIRLSGVGHFGGAAPRTVWAGVAADPALQRVHNRLAGLARETGLKVEKRRFAPHVTLARMAGRRADLDTVAAFEARHGLFRADPFRATAITLIESVLNPSGARHTPLAAFPLG